MGIESKLTRGQFVGMGAAAAATAGLSSIAAHKANAQEDQTAWNTEYDFVVVGSGTGAFAALRAANLGAKRVAIIEKSGAFGGTSVMSGGGFGFPLSRQSQEAGIVDSREEVVKYYMNASVGRANEAVINRWIDAGQGFIDWTAEQLGWQWFFDTSFPLFAGDYYEPVEGWIPLGRSTVATVDAQGNSMTAMQRWEQLQEKLVEAGVDILLETRATELVTDEEGAVIGLRAVGPEGELVIKASAVLIATGGYEHNAEMRRKHLTHPLVAVCSSHNNTGDGHRMGAAIGAELSNMDCFFGAPAILTTGQDPYELLANGEIAIEVAGTDWALYRNMPGAIVVNSKGKRFANEGVGYDPFCRAFGAYDTSAMAYENIPAFFLCDSTYWATYSLPGHSAGALVNDYFEEMYGGASSDEVPSYYVVAQTLEELAEKLGIDVDGLVAEVAAYNANAEAGIDPVWHRGETSFDTTTVSLMSAPRPELANPCLAPLATPPFFGAVYVPGTYSTSGGLTINENAQVMHVNGQPIPGLYACGNCSSGVSGGRYVNGIALASGSTMGWVAAGHALGA